MKKQKILIAVTSIFTACTLNLQAQDTFSIVAADSTTREVGSAGASCVDLFTTTFTDDGFLGDPIPNKGAINTQAAYLAANQTNARTRMNAGDTPVQIITWLSNNANDAQGNSSTRQYGVVGFTGNNVSSAGFTGTGCTNYKNHVTGKVGSFCYSVQGNILLGQQVIDSIEARFRRAPGDLACKLMAALQGGKMVGADTRCQPNNTSTLFAFIKVAQPTDVYGSPTFTVSVRTHNNAMIEPIDTLQKKFDKIHSCTTTSIKDNTLADDFIIYPNPANDVITIESNNKLIGSTYIIIDPVGRKVLNGKLAGKTTTLNINGLAAGIYMFQVGESGKKTFKVLKN
jgi:uncharacterized Ntn-hydrolase superfamily protein